MKLKATVQSENGLVVEIEGEAELVAQAILVFGDDPEGFARQMSRRPWWQGKVVFPNDKKQDV